MCEARRGVSQWTSTVAFAIAALATGCQSVTLDDDVDLELNFSLLTGPSDALHTPYVQGSSMRVYVHATEGDPASDWTLESSNPAVFEVGALMLERSSDGRTYAHSNCRALTEGVALLTVRNGHREVLHLREVRVELPDRIDLLAHGMLLIGRPESTAVVGAANIRNGGTATFLARYYRDGHSLSGNGALSSQISTQVDAHVEKTFLFEDRDWLRISPAMLGDALVPLIVGGAHVADLPIRSVADTEVARIQILGEDESRAEPGSWLVALAQAYDAAGERIWGVDYRWELDGTLQTGGILGTTTVGDLYRYKFTARSPRLLTASFGAVDASAMIHASTGFVDSSNRLGCSSVPGDPHASPVGLPLAFLVLVGSTLGRRWSRRRGARSDL